MCAISSQLSWGVFQHPRKLQVLLTLTFAVECVLDFLALFATLLKFLDVIFERDVYIRQVRLDRTRRQIILNNISRILQQCKRILIARANTR